MPNPAFVQKTDNINVAGTTAAATFGGNNTAGNMLFVVAWCDGTGRTLNISDTAGNTWLPVEAAFTQNSANTVQAFYVANCKAKVSNIVTATSNGPTTTGVAAGEYSFSGAGATLDQKTHAVGVSTSPASGVTGATTQAVELIVGYILESDGSITAGSGFTLRGVASNFLNFEDQTIISTGTQQATATITSAGWAIGVATFFANTPTSTIAWLNRERKFVNKR